MSQVFDANQLAEEIAHGLSEPDAVSSFRTLFRRYSEEAIRRAYEEVLAIPSDRIRKSRGALFIYLLKKYAGTRRTNE
jgi:hypothetical protein